MHMTIRYRSGLTVDAVLLAANRERIRVAIPSKGDTTELNKVDACWLTDDGEEIEIEALIPIDDVEVSKFCTALFPLTLAAGRRSGLS